MDTSGLVSLLTELLNAKTDEVFVGGSQRFEQETGCVRMPRQSSSNYTESN